jgi:hypothetical protein
LSLYNANPIRKIKLDSNLFHIFKKRIPASVIN